MPNVLRKKGWLRDGIAGVAVATSIIISSSYRLDAAFSSLQPIFQGWQDVKVGAGGYLTGSTIANDNTYAVRTDTFGAYLWNPNAGRPQGNAGGLGAWQPLVTTTTMPASFTSIAQQYNQGVYEFVIAPSNSNIMYMMFQIAQAGVNPANSTVYKTINKGQNWTVTAFTPVVASSVDPNNTGIKTRNAKMAVCPTDPNTVYIGAGANGLFKATDGLVSTPTKLTNFPTPTGNPVISGLAINPNNCSEIFGFSSGNGVYHSTDAGVNWTHLTSGTGPTEVGFGIVTANGVYLACDTAVNEDLWRFASGTWTEIFTSGGTNTNCSGIAVDPTNANHVRVVAYNGNMNESTDGGASFGGFSNMGNLQSVVTNDIPWQSFSQNDTRYGLLWDQANPSSGRMYTNGANNFWAVTVAAPITTSTNFSWVSQGVGIEQLVASEIIVPPNPGQNPILCSWDRAVFEPNITAYPSNFKPTFDGISNACWSISSVANDPTKYVANIDSGYINAGTQRSSICTIGGSCTALTLPTNASTGGISDGHWGGNVAASTALNMIFAPGSGGGNTGSQPSYTTNGGSVWTGLTVPGIVSWSGFVMNFFGAHPMRLVEADRVNIGTFYLLIPSNGVYFSTDGGATWTRATNMVSPASPAQMRATPGQAGDIWIASGFQGSPGAQPAGGNLYHLTNANTATPTVTTVANVVEPISIGFGAPKPGNTYPSVLIIGWVSNIYGLWISDDQGSSWQNLDTWPNNSFDNPVALAGDPNNYRRVFVGFNGSGYVWRQF